VEQVLRTKFIVTLGPASMNYDTMRALAEAGANIFRSNFVHMQYEKYYEVKAWTEQINRELGTWVQLQADIQGPSIRMGTLSEDGYNLEAGEAYVFITGRADRDGMDVRELPINDATIHQFIHPNQPITFMNGALAGKVTGVEGNRITVEMQTTGTLKSHKSINLPETELSTSLTEKDRKDLAFLMEAGVDWVAISFVSRAAHIKEVRDIIGNRPTKIISKIERKSAVDHLEEVAEASDALMVARGDLGIEMPMEDVPFAQKEIIEVGHNFGKPVIVATQMMLSMVQSMRPTRAEVSDVATAVLEGADATMLSEETAEGIDPANALGTMVRVARRAEQYLYGQENRFNQYWKKEVHF
jgi:pyruvate kinase